MRALTIRQPWASLIAAGVKTIETRSWSTKYRGPLAIHAGKQWAKGWGVHDLWHDPDIADERRDRNDLLVEKLGCDPLEDCNGSGFWTVDRHGRRNVPLGAVVATCTLADVVPTVDYRHERADTRKRVEEIEGTLWLRIPAERPATEITGQLPFGDFTPGRYAWLLTDVQRLEVPVPAKGRQGLWDCEELDRG